MEKDKKKIIAGASILGAGLIAYFATRKTKGKPPVLQITLSNLTITPTTASPGQAVIISVLATNHSDSALAATINLTGDFTDSADITLDAGTSQTVSFTVTPTAEKTYHVSVGGLSGSFVCTSAPHGDIQLSNLIISPTSCNEGDTVTISATATNQGNANEVMAVTLNLTGSKYADTWQDVHQIILEPGASRIVTFTFQPTVAETYAVIVDGLSGSFVVNPAATWPGWTVDTVVYGLTVTPTILYLGQTVQIVVDIEGPWPATYPMNIEASINVDGTTLSKIFSIDFRNPGLLFTYTPTNVGTFIVTAQDKTATFTVLQDVVAQYYSPYGGTRMPLCTDIVVPNVAPFGSFPGGDLIWSETRLVDMGFHLSLFVTTTQQVKAKLAGATPRTWDPGGATVSEWVSKCANPLYDFGLTMGMAAGLLIMAINYDCQQYWNSKDDLARMIATNLGHETFPAIPDEWKTQYGTTCPTCNGTGQTYNQARHRMDTCPTCGGLGKVLKVDLSRGLRDWVYPIRYAAICGSGYCVPQIYCPYCDAPFRGPSHVQGEGWDKLSFARSFLVHIEMQHPNHPLTEPAWF